MKKTLVCFYIFIFSSAQPLYARIGDASEDIKFKHALDPEVDEEAQIPPPQRHIPNLVYRASITPPSQIAINGGFPYPPNSQNIDLSNYVNHHYLYLTNIVPPLQYSYLEYNFPAASSNSERLISQFEIDREYLRTTPTVQYPIVDYYNYFNAINFASRNPAHPAFTATYSNPAYALRDAFYYVAAYSRYFMNSPTIMTIYLYAIRPNESFVSVTDTYRRELENLRNDPARVNDFEHLERLNDLYTQEDQYLALGRISTNQIAYVDSYYYDYSSRSYRYRYLDGSGNINRETFETFSNTPANLYPNDFPIGTIPNIVPQQNVSEPVSVCYIEPQSSHNNTAERQRRYAILSITDKELLTSNSCLNEPLANFKNIFDEKSIHIAISDMQGNKYCLDTKNYYLSFNAKCDDSVKWLYTEAGQLISGVFDGKNQQIYCLTKPLSTDTKNTRPRMEICDLSKNEQRWYLNQDKNNNYIFNTELADNLNLNDSESYLNISENKSNYKILNYDTISKNISPKYTQFSISLSLKDEHEYEIYPTFNGYLKLDKKENLLKSGYINYYNAHNNAIFSNYGFSKTVGPQVCYASLLIENEGSSWDYAENKYCSTIGEVEHEFKWFFALKNDELLIHDFGKNTLRYSTSRYFYIGGKNWYDSSRYKVPSFASAGSSSNLKQNFSVANLNIH
ncbi:hypothetical protein [Fluviispira vulneris]|uniref:hypothetical protein n=1 Tax=Fluviispira vulneris TaxID=2763012 RepID=UPI001648B731|nr:hypothetical protein [Fluviispira vulneris]